MATKSKQVETTETVVTTNTTAPAPKVQTLSAEDRQALYAKHGSWSAVFRALTAEGKSKGEIAKLLDKRYQHVRNVLITPVGKPVDKAVG
jgi:hypothetical protein